MYANNNDDKGNDDMYDDLRDYLNENNMTTHTFYLSEFIENEIDDIQDPPNVFRVWDHIDTQARLDLFFQRTFDSALDYCVPNDDGTWACMTVEGQMEYIVNPNHMRIMSVSDGMGDDTGNRFAHGNDGQM